MLGGDISTSFQSLLCAGSRAGPHEVQSEPCPQGAHRLRVGARTRRDESIPQASWAACQVLVRIIPVS